MYKPSPMHLYPLKNFSSPSMIFCSFFIVVSYPILTEKLLSREYGKKNYIFFISGSKETIFPPSPRNKKGYSCRYPCSLYEKEKSVFLILFYLFGPV